MKFYPAIDLLGGRPIRLEQGDFSRSTAYPADPEETVERFVADGADLVHVVDLDGARVGKPRQHALIARMAARGPVQAAGGFRDADTVAAMLDAGAERVVIGSLALTDPDAFLSLLDRFGAARITLALDVRLSGGEARVLTHGWEKDSGETLEDVLARFEGVRHLLVTDIGRDGMLRGPNIDLYRTIVAASPMVELQASGGVGELADLELLRKSGIGGAIVGKAIWDGRFTVSEGASIARG
ncbi:1-(5-phosphoribosyl)-5-[(5-phosphoribosylamino)methylideneamino] imidazole-4-carboxamide isomerase [Sphingomicrobium nitratireducens]|uniref:1-(5-phosphoribosyl)-5-[(5- phosphoribosylamino)methylideneamino]imidazole-4- carboxamide isomerase n=1 Tax=Sphingomicrobium nitratireducens TaxID=2964666 RepID=UPI002240194C|nr:1-(5-phosphoribosyl)-5-[(5-phosphoribosylamino)methylideneamino] imidazole-4-carboxamide isomerase [Sphingomicrobium nitratireducens]